RHLELADEGLELLQDGWLREGHGRALLLASDHGARRALASAAVDGGWSVRTAEARARESNRGRAAAGLRRGASSVHPDQEQAAREIAETLGRALGAEGRVRATSGGGYRAGLSFSTPEEAVELARRLWPRAVA